MCKYYITDNIYIKNKKYYFEEEDDKYIKLNNKNWFKYLKNYNWSKMCLGWRKRLKENNKSCFGILDCGSNGDCLFHVISEALNSILILENKSPIYDYEKLRIIASEQINKDNYDCIINSYILEIENKEFMGDWDPLNINNIEELSNEIKKCGNNFWGDHILLQLLQKKLEFNVIIFNSDNYEDSDNIDEKFKILPISNLDNEKYKYTILIYYLGDVHFQLIGYFDGNKMNTIFTKETLPLVVNNVYNQDCRK